MAGEEVWLSAWHCVKYMKSVLFNQLFLRKVIIFKLVFKLFIYIHFLRVTLWKLILLFIGSFILPCLVMLPVTLLAMALKISFYVAGIDLMAFYQLLI